jgi:hypothetical protein
MRFVLPFVPATGPFVPSGWGFCGAERMLPHVSGIQTRGSVGCAEGALECCIRGCEQTAAIDRLSFFIAERDGIMGRLDRGCFRGLPEVDDDGAGSLGSASQVLIFNEPAPVFSLPDLLLID